MLKFNNTSEVEPLEGILGQERAISAMEIGLNIDNPAYNMYLAGDSGTGKTTYAMEALNKYASQKSSHKDWVYVHNFDNIREPIVIGLEKGLGKIFKKDIEKLIETLLDEFFYSGIKQFEEVAKTILHWKEYILNSFILVESVDGSHMRRLSNGPIEGINSILEKININGNGYTNFYRFRNRAIYCVNKDVPLKNI